MVNQKKTYCFLSDEQKRFYRAKQSHDGSYIISSNSQPYPIKFNPRNLKDCQVEFATNKKYNSLARSINYPLEFVNDGAAILRNVYSLGKAIEQKTYLTIIEWNGESNIYELSYFGRIDYSQRKDSLLANIFTVSCIDDSAWGVLSQNDAVDYAIDCSPSNPDIVKVLIDEFTLLNRYTFQTVQAPITAYSDGNGLGQFKTMPFVLINQDGDSSGLSVQSQSSYPIKIDGTGGWHISDPLSPGFFLLTQYPTSVSITGKITFKWSSLISKSGGGAICIMSNKRVYPITGSFAFANVIADFSNGNLVPGKTYSYSFSFDFDLDADERLFLIIVLNDNNANKFEITPIVDNSYISTKTSTQPTIVYGLRPLDYLKQLVAKATNNRFTIDSNFFTINNKSVITSGDSIRQIPNAKIYGSLQDFFQTFDSIYFLALRVVNGALFIEKATDVYKDVDTIIDLGDAIEVDIETAEDYYGNEIEVGSPKQDYRHPSGRLEFNSTNTFSLPILTVNKKISYVTKYRLGCFDIIFLILDYQGQSTKDNSGDKSVYLLDISDEKGSAVNNIETFENVTIDNSPLQPIIKQPLNNDTITYNKPIIRGIAPAGSNVSIFVDNVLDGSTSAGSDNNWSYQIVNSLTAYELGVHTGIHTIDATYTDESAPKSTISILIDTSYNTDTIIIYPNPGDSIYNNLPLIKGIAQQGAAVLVKLDGVEIGNLIADSSCKWELQSPLIHNGDHILDANGNSINFTVDNNVKYPLITYVASQLDGFAIIDNLPLIKGVSAPNEVITLWLNYISYTPLGQTRADANGNWSFQVVDVSYKDPLTGIDQIIAPIKNGLNIISTSLTNFNVSIVESGYKLNRPAFTSITGVVDNTVFNVNFSPQRMLQSHYPMLASMITNQPGEKVYFQTADKNAAFTTVLNGVTISENADVPVSSLGKPIALLEYGNIKIKSSKTFAKTLYDFNNGGVIKCNFKGTDLFFLPIGQMKMPCIDSDVQEWKLLMSTRTTYQSLLNISTKGLLITLNKNSMYHSDRNSLHFVKYGYVADADINFPDIYDDWFNNRNGAWSGNPDYIQKYQQSETIRDQIIVNNVSDISLKMYRCSDASLVDTFNYSPIVPAPINPPNVVLEAVINFANYPVGQYFFILFVGSNMVSISERVETRVKWYNTILIKSSNSKNEVGFFYSTGIQSIYRVEGIVKKWQPSVSTIIANEESGNNEILYSQNERKRFIRFGTAYGLPDYLYLKIADALTNDNLVIEGINYVLDKDEKIEPSDDVDGHPMYYYNVGLTLAESQKGYNFTSGSGGEIVGDRTGAFLVIDAEAVGLPRGSLITIELDNE